MAKIFLEGAYSKTLSGSNWGRILKLTGNEPRNELQKEPEKKQTFRRALTWNLEGTGKKSERIWKRTIKRVVGTQFLTLSISFLSSFPQYLKKTGMKLERIWEDSGKERKWKVY